MKQPFFDFLNEHRCFKRYMDALNEHNEEAKRFLYTFDPECWLRDAFPWESEGSYEYWSELNDLWINKLKYSL